MDRPTIIRTEVDVPIIWDKDKMDRDAMIVETKKLFKFRLEDAIDSLKNGLKEVNDYE